MGAVMSAPNYTSPTVARLDDGSYRIRQAGHVIAVDAAQAAAVVRKLQFFLTRKARDDWDCV